jgi:hypothetical protein
MRLTTSLHILSVLAVVFLQNDTPRQHAIPLVIVLLCLGFDMLNRPEPCALEAYAVFLDEGAKLSRLYFHAQSFAAMITEA